MIRSVFVELLDLAIEKGDCKSRRMEEKPVFAIRIRIEKKPTDWRIDGETGRQADSANEEDH